MKHTVTFFNLGFLLTSVLSLFMVNAPTYNDLVNNDKTLAKQYDSEYNLLTLDDEAYANRLEAMGINLHPQGDSGTEADIPLRSLNHCKSLVYRTLESLPEEPVKKLKHLTLLFSDTGRRGLGGGNTIILRCQNVTDNELVGVLVHEMGHIMDTGVMSGSAAGGSSKFMDGVLPVYNDDSSLDFYKLSFDNEKTRKKGASKLDFVSGYAMSDPYEDFAESYAYYILHGTEFRELAKYNKVLNSKYEYLKTRVFDGKEYFNGKEIGKAQARTRYYDVTVLSYDIDKFFKV